MTYSSLSRKVFLSRKWLQYKLLKEAGFDVHPYVTELTQQVEAAGYSMSEIQEECENLAWSYGIQKFKEGK